MIETPGNARTGQLPAIGRSRAPFARREAITLASGVLLAQVAFAGCLPMNDLDLAKSGSAGAGRFAVNAQAGSAGSRRTTPIASGGGGLGGEDASLSRAGSSGIPDAGPDAVGVATNQGGTSDPGPTPQAGGETAGGGSAGGGSAGGSSAGDSSGGSGGSNLPLAEMPNDLPNAPVVGTVACWPGTYTIGSVIQNTYEVETPTAIYTVLRSSGNIIDLNDKTSDSRLQWVGISDYRPKRGVGLTMTPQPAMTTTLDQDSVTAKHVRLIAQSVAGDFGWVWDFYVTQATLTVKKAGAPFGFTYRGTPGGSLGSSDRLGLSNGAVQSASDSYYGDLPGPAEWAYVFDLTLGHSLFLIQHLDDGLGERYDAKDADSATFTFGDGKISETPARFSLGLVGSATFSAVQARVAYVVHALQ